MDERRSLRMVSNTLRNLDRYRILLASNSPRRRELLAGLGIKYDTVSLPDIDESYPTHLKGGEIPAYISNKKAESYKSLMHEDTLLITADTIVWLNGRVFGKPNDEAEAVQMLKELSGNTHTVYTGVTLTTRDRECTFTTATDVKFAKLTEEEIEFYVRKYVPLDKAGAYGVQEWIGYIGVEAIYGSYYNVMGLPLQRLYRELLKF